jgi:hypothetical protein
MLGSLLPPVDAQWLLCGELGALLAAQVRLLSAVQRVAVRFRFPGTIPRTEAQCRG